MEVMEAGSTAAENKHYMGKKPTRKLSKLGESLCTCYTSIVSAQSPLYAISLHSDLPAAAVEEKRNAQAAVFMVFDGVCCDLLAQKNMRKYSAAGL